MSEVRRILVEDYGWPHQFREDDWKRDADAHFEMVKFY